MARNGSPSAENPVIPEIVRRLVETYHPESVYLFGSAARGDASLDSDYDFMIVMPNDAPVALRRPAKAYECLRGLAVPKDILISTSVDFEKHLIQVPAVARARRLVAQAVGVSLTELKAPFSDCLIAERDATHR